MKIITWNTRGFGDQSKQLALKRSLKNTNLDLVLTQETKRDSFEIDLIKAQWSSKDVGSICVEAYGKSGGMLTKWDESKISITEVLKDYKKRFIWPELFSLSNYCLEAWCLGGDFNITRTIQECYPAERMT